MANRIASTYTERALRKRYRPICALVNFLFVDKSSPELFNRTREESQSITLYSLFPILDIFTLSADRPRPIRNQSEVA